MSVMESNGYEVTGLDLNQEMLDIARTRCSGRLVRQDMRKIFLTDTYDALICLGRAFGYMLTDNDAIQAVRCFNNVLREDGLLILDSFDAETSKKHIFGEWRETSFEFDDSVIVRRSRSYDFNSSDNTWNVEWEWEYTGENGENKMVLDQAMLRSYDGNDLEKTLQDNGFNVIKKLQDRQLTIVAKKTAP